MKRLLKFCTRVGMFYVEQSDTGSYLVTFNGDILGEYGNPWHATQDVAQNATDSVIHPSSGELIDTSDLGIPEDPSEWERLN